MKLFSLLFLFCLFALSKAGYVAIFGQKRTVAGFNETTGQTNVIGTFKTTPPAKFQQWILTTLKTVDQGRRRVFFVFEDVTFGASSVHYFDLNTRRSFQGPIFPYRLRALHFDVQQKRLFATTDFEKGISDATLIEIDPETLERSRVIATLNAFGSPGLASTYDQKRGFLSFASFNFTSNTHYLITVDTRAQGPSALVYTPRLSKTDWHILTVAFDETSDKLAVLWNLNGYAPLFLRSMDRETGNFVPEHNVTVIDWKRERDSMTTDSIPFAKDSVHGHLLAFVTAKSLNQYLVLLDLKQLKVLYSKVLVYPDTLGYDMTPVYVE